MEGIAVDAFPSYMHLSDIAIISQKLITMKVICCVPLLLFGKYGSALVGLGEKVPPVYAKKGDSQLHC
jgi:hypothetical protein